MISELLRLALQSLQANLLRSLLTVLGVVIGVFSIVALLGIGQGVKAEVSQQITELGSNLIVVLPGQVETEGGGFNPAASIGASTLTEGDVAAVRELSEVVATTPLGLLAGLPVAGERRAPSALTLAVEPSYFDLFSTAKHVAGRLLTPEDTQERRRVAVLDRGPRRALFPHLGNNQVIRQTFSFAGQTFTVVGLVESPEASTVFGGTSFSTGVFIPFATTKEFNENTQVFRIALEAAASAEVEAVAGRVRQLIKERHAGTEDFTVLTQADILAVIDEVIALLTKAVTGIGAISLLVGGIGIMNIMLVSVTERTREIGIRKALGAANGNILLQFLIEAVVLSLIGGGLGLAAAGLASFPLDRQLHLPLVIGWRTVGLGFLFSFTVGVIFGVAPAVRASRLNPIDALRYE